MKASQAKAARRAWREPAPYTALGAAPPMSLAAEADPFLELDLKEVAGLQITSVSKKPRSARLGGRLAGLGRWRAQANGFERDGPVVRAAEPHWGAELRGLPARARQAKQAAPALSETTPETVAAASAKPQGHP